MTSSTTNINLDLTPKGLFPHLGAADQDPKCVIIAEVIQQLTRTCDMSDVTLAELQDNAQKRFVDLSQQARLSLPDADHRAYILFQKGISHVTAQKYYSFRLSEVDRQRWKISII